MKRGCISLGLLLFLVVIFGSFSGADAQRSGGGFSLQVTPSPLISTIEPGKQTTLEVKVKNGNTESERLKMELRAFSVDKTSGEIKISEQEPSEVIDFVNFGEESFSLEAGQWYTQKVNINTPKEAGFSYSFVILISREKPAPKVEGTSAIEGSVALFTLLNVNRPDATRKLSLTSFIASKRVYEYLPADFELSVENDGNTITQPKGNVFIGRSGDEESPTATMVINRGNGYIIPGSTRLLKTTWSDGFPSVNEKGDRVWDWSILNKLRIGKYTAKAIIIYDDGERDIPTSAEVTFWVFPWKIMLGVFVLVALLIVGIYTVFRRSFGVVNVVKKKPPKPSE